MIYYCNRCYSFTILPLFLQSDNIAYEITEPNSMGFDSLGGGDSVEVTVVAAIVAVIVLFAGVSIVWRYHSC